MGALLPLEEIRASSSPISRDNLSGIYFLFLDYDLVYIGKSISYLGRLQEHFRQNKFEFNRVAFLHADSNDLDFLEAEYINAYKPPENKFIPPVFEVVFVP